MILLLGASGYVGQAFAAELRRRRWPFIPLTRRAVDYTCFDVLFSYVRRMRPAFLVNAAGCAPHPNEDACEPGRKEVLWANAVLPQTIARVCRLTHTPWGHVSSGSIYTGAKVVTAGGQLRIERNLNLPEIRRLFAEQPDRLHGFNEWDEPNFSFRQAPCNFYSGTKALAEETIQGVGDAYIWRPRRLFHHRDDGRNLLSKLLHDERIYDTLNSLSSLEDFVRAGLDLWEARAPYGTYNLVNPGAITTRQIVELIRQILQPDRDFEFWKHDPAFDHGTDGSPRSDCVLDSTKLLLAGVTLPPVADAIKDCLQKWQPAGAPLEYNHVDADPLPAPTGAEAFEKLFA